MRRWFHFEMAMGPRGHGQYLGKCLATPAEVRKAFPYCEIESDGLVRIYGPPDKQAVKDAERSRRTGKPAGMFAANHLNESSRVPL